jgi:methylamine dehydrogenase heavy chain
MRRIVTVLAFACGMTEALAQLPLDKPGTMDMSQVRNRIYVGDVAINHIVDGRIHIVDGDSGKYLGLIGAGFAGQFTQSPDRRELYVATTYLSRLQRGDRVDVVEVYDADTLAFKHEIPIAATRAQALGYRGYVRTSADGRLLYVLNATPAVSVTVVDLQQKKQVAEVETPGCWGIYPAAGHPRRFSTLCGDGNVGTYTLNDDGTQPAQGGRENSDRVFDPDGDALFIHAEQQGDTYWFVSFKGDVVGVNMGGARASGVARWSLVKGSDPKKAWRPGGYAPLALDAGRGRLYVAMHDGGREGSHKMPAKEIWAVDLASKRRVARLPGQSAIALHAPSSGDPMLYAIDGMKNALVVMGGPKYAVRHRVTPIGDASVLLESR